MDGDFMCKDLVRLTTQDVSKAVLITDSKIVSNEMDKTHKNVTNLINKYKKDIEGFGKVVSEIRPLPSGQKEKIYLLNEQQVTFIITLMRNNSKVVLFKKKLVEAFYLMKNELQARQETRHISKSKRVNFTDSIKQNVIGEGNFKNYAYSNYTKLVYKKVIGTTVKKYKQKNNIPKQSNIRDYFTIDQIEQVQELESKIATYIEMRKDTGETDKEIYQEVKKYLEKLED